MSVVLIHSDRFIEHQTPPGHPECPERAQVLDLVAAQWRRLGLEVVAPRAATRDQLARVHDDEFLRLIASTAGRAVKLDPDTYTSPESHDVALLAAGAVIDAVEQVMSGPHRSAVALVRPPGHHAERGRAMGFCLYNNVAVGAAHARAGGARKVAIVDYDVHHGNGTQHIFEADPHVLYISTHQYPYYPGTGAAEETGVGAGKGYTVNLPLEAGAVPEDFQAVFDDVVLPVLRQFEPDLLMISAGFDAHANDPLGGLRLPSEAFTAMTHALRGVAEECCHGRVVAVTEGGYDLQALGECTSLVIDALNGPAAQPIWPRSGIPSKRGRIAVEQARPSLRPYWSLP